MDEALRSVNLYNGGVGDRQAGRYSGGMKRRLSVAISLMGRPQVVYLDEPSTVGGLGLGGFHRLSLSLCWHARGVGECTLGRASAMWGGRGCGHRAVAERGAAPLPQGKRHVRRQGRLDSVASSC